jgi:2-polyprenyl-3-methyl-5-hydroxy-6-metoxy-1,4-benzoquinol methylase
MTTNADLQAKYDQMHAQGSTAWFSDGENERKAILTAGEPWGGLSVLEIGCGEGGLARKIAHKDALIVAMDYSSEAIRKAHSIFSAYGKNPIYCLGTPRDNIESGTLFDRVVLMGVLEHFDSPWAELDWIARNLVREGGDIITSSPCFLNPRGIVWMTLATLFDAPMSLTDLHFLHPWEFEKFAKTNDCVKALHASYTDRSWGYGEEMTADLRQRLPKVFPEMDRERIDQLVDWLGKAGQHVYSAPGATAVYRLELK